MIFNIQRFSTHDGEGIRTIIFYKGCTLRCRWCCNPESFSFGYSIMYDRRRCKNFGDCINENPEYISRNADGSLVIDRENIESVERLSSTCPAKAISVAGEIKSVADIAAEAEKDKVFYINGGGVTLSGGEPLAQDEELYDLLAELKSRNISVTVETSLHVKWLKIERCIGLADSFLVDLKHFDKVKFKEFTGGDLELILGNLVKLTDRNANVVLRIPVLPGFNHTDTDMEAIIDLAATLKNVKEIHFLPYHSLGAVKYNMLGMDYHFGSMNPVRDEELEGYMQYANLKGFRAKTGG